MITQTQIDEKYNELSEATYRLQTAQLVHNEAKTTVDRDIAEATANGAITGKNAAERTANGRLMFADQFDKIDALAETVARAKLRYELASIEVERVRLTMRLIEATGAVVSTVANGVAA